MDKIVTSASPEITSILTDPKIATPVSSERPSLHNNDGNGGKTSKLSISWPFARNPETINELRTNYPKIATPVSSERPSLHDNDGNGGKTLKLSISWPYARNPETIHGLTIPKSQLQYRVSACLFMITMVMVEKLRNCPFHGRPLAIQKLSTSFRFSKIRFLPGDVHPQNFYHSPFLQPFSRGETKNLESPEAHHT